MSGLLGQRRVFKGVSSGQGTIRDLLCIAFAQEILVPSRTLLIVAPWITNIVIFNNRNSHYSALNPEWSERDIGLIAVLVQLIRSGTSLHIAYRPNNHNEIFSKAMMEACQEGGVGGEFRMVSIETLHTKGILADTWLLTGSMNLTRNGVEMNDEYVAYDTRPRALAEARISFRDLFNSTDAKSNG
jgi:hypothetical protein